ncbi:hypothetical protein QVN42_08235 [Yersinia nurmii]|uniref:Thymidylate synthase n=1 Tax=Yersinia nurmii TaxID=685706 RepID=A0AAW7JY23_9GAMM|nr:hypothetical protein [Yersinia nurmii]MDN0087381.1 hypothetical protein [Yersinia nurmii]CNE93359.1 Uncharacterised protein [Yersinia nurmii]
MSFYQSDVYVDYGSLFIFHPETNNLFRQNSLYSCLLAQLNADEKTSRFLSSKSWFVNYVQILESIFWQFSEVKSDRYRPDKIGADLVLKDLMSDFFREIAPPDASRSVVSGMELLLEKPLTEEAIEVYHAGTFAETDSDDFMLEPYPGTVTRVKLQVNFVSNLNVISTLCLFFTTAEIVKGHLLSQKFSTQEIVGDIHVYTTTATLHERSYAVISQRVKDKIQSKVDDFIFAL